MFAESLNSWKENMAGLNLLEVGQNIFSLTAKKKKQTKIKKEQQNKTRNQ